MSSKTRPVTSAEQWKTRLAGVAVSKDDLNALVANYLFTEGFRGAAENFSREAGLRHPIDLGSLESRMAIRRAVQRGDVEQATEMVNELDPEILDRNPSLHFALLQQHLIELIRAGEIEAALSFAATELAPRGEAHPEFLAELERTMALLAFELPTATAAPSLSASTAKNGKPAAAVEVPETIRGLLAQEKRQETAKELNAAILTSQSHGREPKLPGLLRMLAWGEGLLGERCEFPRWQFHDLLKDRAVQFAGPGAGETDGGLVKEEPAAAEDAMVL